jgi:hypothetical protein
MNPSLRIGRSPPVFLTGLEALGNGEHSMTSRRTFTDVGGTDEDVCRWHFGRTWLWHGCQSPVPGFGCGGRGICPGRRHSPIHSSTVEVAAMLHSVLLATSDNVEAAGFILRGIKGIFVAIGSVIAAIVCAVIAGTKGRSAIGWGLLGLFFSIITLIVVIVIPSKKS